MGLIIPMWSYIMRRVLVAKGLWGVVEGTEVHPHAPSTPSTIDSEGDCPQVTRTTRAANAEQGW